MSRHAYRALTAAPFAENPELASVWLFPGQLSCP